VGIASPTTTTGGSGSSPWRASKAFCANSGDVTTAFASESARISRSSSVARRKSTGTTTPPMRSTPP
jgi:hypothetical protein